MARPEHRTTSILFNFGFLPKWVFFVVTCTCSVITGEGVTGSAKQLNLLLVQRLLHRHTCHDGFDYGSGCKFIFACFVVDPRFVEGDLGHDFA